VTHERSIASTFRTKSGLDLSRFCPPAPPRLEDWLAEVIPPGAPSIDIGGRVPCFGEPLFVPVDQFEIAEPGGGSDRWFWTLMSDMEAAFKRDIDDPHGTNPALLVGLVALGGPDRLTGGYLYPRRMAALAGGHGALIEFVSVPVRPFPLAVLDAPAVLARARLLGAGVVAEGAAASGPAGREPGSRPGPAPEPGRTPPRRDPVPGDARTPRSASAKRPIHDVRPRSSRQ